jgi:hypothetical protein
MGFVIIKHALRGRRIEVREKAIRKPVLVIQSPVQEERIAKPFQNFA